MDICPPRWHLRRHRPSDVRHHVHKPEMACQTSHEGVSTVDVYKPNHDYHDQLDMSMRSPEDHQQL